ncbi:MAG: amidohydrolase family protein [Streptosporangiales bacterium]|nr:amidohydrolase family protein [Streptosporangiales bacterium]
MPDILYANARITTLWPALPAADALLVRGERVVAVGSAATCRAAARRGYREVDLGGGYVVPGLTDSHIHLAGYAFAEHQLDLRGVCDLAEAQRRLQAFAQRLPAGAWVFGGRFDANRWQLDRPLHRRDLDPFSAGHPVALESHDSHSAWVNTQGLAALGIDEHTAQQSDGRLERDADGPTGLLRESAAEPVRALVTEHQAAGIEPMLADALRELLAHGVTGVHDIDGRETAAAYRALRERGELPARVHQLIYAGDLDAAIEAGEATGDGDRWESTGPVKLFADGALGSHTAALSAPYEDAPEDTGVVMLDRVELAERVLTAAGAGIAVAVHAIGDAANTAVLDALAEVRRRGVGASLRHRIEHAQHVAWHDVPRFAELGVVASMQPVHHSSDVALAAALLGDRPLASYAWSDLAAAGAHVAFGSDAPVETLDPIAGIKAATARAGTGEQGRNAIAPLQALHGYTTQPAYASYEEHTKGRLAVGYLADFVVLDADLTDPDVATSGAAQPQVTVVGGRVRWQR